MTGHDGIAYEIGKMHRRYNKGRSDNPYRALSGLVPTKWRTRALLSWCHGWDDQDADLAAEVS